MNLFKHTQWLSKRFPEASHRTVRKFSSPATQHLASVLSSHYDRLKEEKYAKMPSSLKNLKDTIKSGYRFEPGVITKLHRRFRQTRVQISFDCRDTVTVDPRVNEVSQFKEDWNEEDLIDKYGVPIHFKISLLHRDGRSFIIFGIAKKEAFGLLRVAAVSGRENVEKVHDGILSPGRFLENYYFGKFDDRLKQSFFYFLEDDLLIDAHMATFISWYGTFQRRRRYVEFLDELKSVL